MKKIKNRILGVIITIVIAIILNYLFLPAISLRSIGFYIFIFVIIIISGLIQVIIDEIEKDKRYLGLKINIFIILFLFGIMVIGGLSSSEILNAKSYQKLANIEMGNFKNDINTIDQTHNISIVDVETAQKVGDRTVGAIKNSSWYEVGDEYNLIKYQNIQFRISELNYGGFFKYQKAKNEGIPGYVIVNTENQEAEYVELKENKINYSESAYFSKDLRRHLRKQYKSYIFGKSFFEIDEDGLPYYITAVKTPTIGLFGGKKEESFIITNTSTGESKEYKTDELPDWVDHAYDLSYLMNIASYNLKFVNGFWNSIFSRTGIVQTSYAYRNSFDENEEKYVGYNTTLTSNGEIVFYTGLTPSNNAESNVGFLLLSPKTGVIKRYDVAGAEENSAMQSAESLVQDLKYNATFPTILNVDGNETYFMLLKDKAGLVQRYALCNITNYTKVVQAETLDKSLSLYKEKLGVKQEDNINQEIIEKTGKITEIYQAQIDGYTYFYFTFENDENLYMSSITNNYEQVKFKVQDEIKIKYNNIKNNKAYLIVEIGKIK